MARKKHNGFKPVHLTPSIVPPSREPITALTPTQKVYLKYLAREDQVVAIGPAGTGKTFLPSMMAIDQLLDGKINKIVVTRPVVGAGGEELGFFPGSEQEKYGHWTRPVIDAFEQRAGKHRVNSFLYHGQIELAPLSTMRGRTLDDSIVLLDEGQNASWELMKMLVTRIGKGTQLFVTGDLRQTDIHGVNGLAVMVDIIKRQGLPVPIVEFTTADVVRSELCSMWVTAIERHENG